MADRKKQISSFWAENFKVGKIEKQLESAR